MFGFRKPKGKRSIRKRPDGSVRDEVDEEETPTDVVKRSVKSTGRQESRTLGASSSTGLSFGDESASDVISPKKPQTGLRIEEVIVEQRIEDSEDQRSYTIKEIEALKSSTDRLVSATAMDIDLEEVTADKIKEEQNGVAYPFATDGIPNAQEIYLAKKLRRQRQIVQRNDDEDIESDVHMEDVREREDYIALSDDLASSCINTTTARADDDLLDDGDTEGEDELDTIIIDKTERAEFLRNAQKAKEESIEKAQDEEEPSDWENEQLRNAGIASATIRSIQGNGRLSASLPKNNNSYKYDSSHLAFLLGQEKNQLSIEQERLQVAQSRHIQSNNTLEKLQSQMNETQKQWDHFSSLVRSL
ncbi:hypothetical protein GGI26_002446 [Coemansia sp. RSA 1358]|uniref:Uncharacterized protein n=1 Tax=Coemansia umbellata TaxID=1424467 RepID=A0ABQ8PGG8_9FUNG|nr:hypothetical protein EDC05_005205 [Coemansia umbellata]KAJ2623408.1 hypothetical protein GGI26_002446 [Coemansia sp. RSA 1358]